MGEDRAVGLRGKRVVITRALEQSRELAGALEAKGAVPILLPMVAFSAPDNIVAVDEAIRELGTFDWIFMTSQNALRALQERCDATQAGLKTAIGHARVAAVGPATADALRGAGICVSYVAARHQGVSLAHELSSEVKRKRVFLPRSDRANPELVKQLIDLGATVKEVIVYKTVSPDGSALVRTKAALQRGVDAILFFSPSAVHHLQDMLGSERVLEMSRQGVVFAAIGPVTETALRAANIERVIVAEDTTATSIMNSLEKYFSTPQTGSSVGVNSV